MSDETKQSDTPQRYGCTDGGARYCYGCYTMTKDDYGDWVRFEDYEQLERELADAKAEIERQEKLIKALERQCAIAFRSWSDVEPGRTDRKKT